MRKHLKKIVASIIFSLLVVAGVSFSEYFPDVIVTSPNGIWTDTRAYTTLNAAVTAVGANNRSIYILRQETVTTLTIPDNVDLYFFGRGAIANSGQLTINTKNISAPNWQIFKGAGNIDFASGTILKTGWFANVESAFALTTNDTVTLIVSKPQTITASFSPGNNVHLKWDAPGNILTINAGVTVGNIKNVEAGRFQILSGAGNLDFLDGAILNLKWFPHLRNVISWASTTDDITLVVSDASSIDYSDTVPPNIKLRFEKGGNMTVQVGVTLTVDTYIEADPYQVIFIKFGTILVSTPVYATWFGADHTGVLDSQSYINNAVLSGAPIVDGANGLYYVSAKITLSSNVTLRNMKLYDPDYRTTGKHNFIESVGTLVTNKTNIHLQNIEILGNNSTYAVSTDTWAYNIYGYIDGIGIFFRYVSDSTIRDIKCQYMESCSTIALSTNIDVNGLKSTQAEAQTHTGFTFAACYDSIATNIRIFNGGDGALFIYNGSNVHIRNSLVSNTTPATYNLAGAGIETAVNCSMDNVKAEGSWLGFALVEAALNTRLVNSTADGCHVGVMVGPFGYGKGGGDILIANNSIIHMTDDGATTYPVSGIFIYNDNAAYATSHTVRIENNYIGMSNDGVPVYADLVATKELQRFIIKGNFIQVSTAAAWNWETQTTPTYDSESNAMYLRGLQYGSVEGNYIQDTGTSRIGSSVVEMVRCTDITFHDNMMNLGGSTAFLSSDATSARISAKNNIIIGLVPGGIVPFYMLGANDLVVDNPGWGESLVTSSNATKTVATDMIPFGYNRIVNSLNQTVNLPPAVPYTTGSLGNVTPLKVSITSTANTTTVHPTAGDTIRGLVMSADDTVTVGTTKTYACYITGFWEIE